MSHKPVIGLDEFIWMRRFLSEYIPIVSER
jgi:hypothetical protein